MLGDVAEKDLVGSVLSNGETDRYPVNGFGSFTAVNMFNPSLFVNEIMAINDSTISDESGEFDDWFEIYNPEDYPVRLEGFYVSDKKDNLTKWQFPVSDIEILKQMQYPNTGRSVDQELANNIATIGENMNVRRTKILKVSNGVITSYIHNSVADGLGLEPEDFIDEKGYKIN